MQLSSLLPFPVKVVQIELSVRLLHNYERISTGRTIGNFNNSNKQSNVIRENCTIAVIFRSQILPTTLVASFPNGGSITVHLEHIINSIVSLTSNISCHFGSSHKLSCYCDNKW